MDCPECESILQVPADVISGEIVTCSDCGSSYEIQKDPSYTFIELKPAETVGEDWGE